MPYTPSLANQQPPEPPPEQGLISQLLQEVSASTQGGYPAVMHSPAGYDNYQVPPVSVSQTPMNHPYLQSYEKSPGGFTSNTAEPYMFQTSYAPATSQSQMYLALSGQADQHHTHIPYNPEHYEHDVRNGNMTSQILAETTDNTPNPTSCDNMMTNPFHGTSVMPIQNDPQYQTPSSSDIVNGNAVNPFANPNPTDFNAQSYQGTSHHVTFNIADKENENPAGQEIVDNYEYVTDGNQQRSLSTSDTDVSESSCDVFNSGYTDTISSVSSTNYLIKPTDSDEEATSCDEEVKEFYLNSGYASGSSMEVLGKDGSAKGTATYNEYDEREEAPLLNHSSEATENTEKADDDEEKEATEADPLKQVEEFVHHHLIPIAENEVLSLDIQEIDCPDVPSVPPSPVIPSTPKYGLITNNLTVADESFLFQSQTSLQDIEGGKDGKRAVTMQNLHERNSFLNLTSVSKIGKACQRGLIYLKDDLTFGSLASLNAMAAKNLKDPAQEISLIDDGKDNIDVIPSRKHRKNVLALSICISLYFISTGSVRNLQSSLNHEGGVGIISIALSFVGYMLGSIFSASIVVSFQPRKCIIINLIPSLVYIAVNAYPTVWLMAPASLIQGIALSIIWNAMSTYITFLSRGRALKKGEEFEKVSSNFFGIFCLLYQSYHIVGNLIASLVLMPHGDSAPMVTNLTVFPNATNQTIVDAGNVDTILYEQPGSVPLGFEVDAMPDNFSLMDVDHLSYCGAAFCNHFEIKGSGVTVADETKYLLLSIYMGCIIIAMAIAGFILEPLNPRLFPSSESNLAQMKQQVVSLCKFSINPKFLLLFPLCMYSIMQFGFISGEVTMAFVTCPIGIHMVGYTMICFGLSGSICSYFSGLISRYTGRIPHLVIAGVLNIGVLVFMTQWRPGHDNLVPYFVMMGLWGVSDGIWNCQVNSLVGVVFPDKYEEAYAGLRFAQGLGVAILFSFSNAVCMAVKIYFVAGVVSLAVILYLVVEFILRHEVRVNKVVELKQTSV